MWLMTKHGFYSIVAKKPGEYHVRSREPRDLQNLIDRIPLTDCRIVVTKEADYAARIITDQDTVQKILHFLGDTLDYSNFKGQIARTGDQRHKPYHEIWDVLADALGAHGHPAKRKPDSHPTPKPEH